MRIPLAILGVICYNRASAVRGKILQCVLAGLSQEAREVPMKNNKSFLVPLLALSLLMSLFVLGCGGGGAHTGTGTGTGSMPDIGGPTIASFHPMGSGINLSASQVAAVGYTVDGNALYAQRNMAGVAGVLLTDGVTFVPLPDEYQPSATQYNVTAFVQGGWVVGICGPSGSGTTDNFAYAFNPITKQKYMKSGLFAPECVSNDGKALVMAAFTSTSSGNVMTGHVAVTLSSGAQSVLAANTTPYTVLKMNAHGEALLTVFIDAPTIRAMVERRALANRKPATKKSFGGGGVNKGFYWAGSGSVVSALPVKGDTQSLVADMNDSGLIIGTSINSDGSTTRPCYWVRGGSPHILSLPTGKVNGLGESVNNDGQMFGTTFPADGSISATAWSGTSVTPQVVNSYTDVFTVALTGGHIMAQDNSTGVVQDMTVN